MIPIVRTLAEAETWFLQNSSGHCLCEAGDDQLEVDCFPDAEAFFARHAGDGPGG